MSLWVFLIFIPYCYFCLYHANEFNLLVFAPTRERESAQSERQNEKWGG